MISANNVTLRIGKRALFEDVNIKFTEGNCYGLIGANGAGKSTFLKILSGVIEPSKGDIAITPGQRLSVLEQDHYKYDDYQVLDTVILGNKRLYEIMKEKDAIYAKEDFTDEDGVRASELEGEFADLNGWEAESDAATLLNGLGIDTDLHYAYMRELDGGQKVKVLQNGLLFRGGQIDLHRDKQHLGRHAAVVPGQLLKQNALMRSVLVDKAKLTAALGDDIGLEHLADKAQRLACRRRGQRRLLGTCADHVGQGA